MAFNVQHVRLLMTTSGKSLIWLGVGGMDALNLPVLPVSGMSPAMHGRQRFSTAPNSRIIYPISYLTRLKNEQVSVVLTQTICFSQFPSIGSSLQCIVVGSRGGLSSAQCCKDVVPGHRQVMKKQQSLRIWFTHCNDYVIAPFARKKVSLWRPHSNQQQTFKLPGASDVNYTKASYCIMQVCYNNTVWGSNNNVEWIFKQWRWEGEVDQYGTNDGLVFHWNNCDRVYSTSFLYHAEQQC